MFKGLREAWQNFWGSNYTYGNALNTQHVDEENYGWEPLTREAKSGTQRYLQDEIETIRSASQFLYKFNCHYSGLINTYLKYVFGQSFRLESKKEAENQKWDAWKKYVRFRGFSKEIGRRFYRDGEVFIWSPQWRFINPSLVCTPPIGYNVLAQVHYGIEEDPEDPIRPAAYWVKQGKNFERIPAEEIIHIKDCDQDEWRGLPKFLAVMAKSRAFEKWLGDRMTLNRIRASIALLRSHKNSSPDAVKTFADAQRTQSQPNKTTNYGASLRQKIYEPGTILDSTNIDYKYLEPNLQAADVQHDGRQILLAIGAATGLPEFLVSGDSSNANYASHLVSEGAATKEFDSEMERFAEVFLEIWEKVQRQEIWKTDGVTDEPDVILPSIVTRNKLDETKRREILFQNGAITVEEWRGEEGYDPNGAVHVDFADLQ